MLLMILSATSSYCCCCCSFCCCLLEVGVGSVGLDQSTADLLNPAGERELDLGVVGLGDQGATALARCHSLAPDDLDGVSSGPVSGSHVTVTLGDGSVYGQVPVLSVHVVGSRPGVVPQPHSKVLDLERVLLLDLLDGDDLAGGLFELTEL